MILRLANITDTAINPAARSSNGTPLFNNPCPDCGEIRLSDRRRIGKPCMPCANKRRATHGLVGHPAFKLLMNMRARCEQPRASSYVYYGGRGIKVCDEWVSDPAAFVKWALAAGYRKGLEIDRKDTDGPYAPWNCQFLPHVKNSRKRRNAQCDEARAAEVRRRLSAGESISQAAQASGVPYMVAWHIGRGNTWT